MLLWVSRDLQEHMACTCVSGELQLLLAHAQLVNIMFPGSTRMMSCSICAPPRSATSVFGSVPRAVPFLDALRAFVGSRKEYYSC